jgi:hypothetical protein
VLDEHEADHGHGRQDLQDEEKVGPDLHLLGTPEKS